VCSFSFHQLYIQHKKIDKEDYKKLLICAVFGVAANMLMFFKGLSLTKPINGAVLMLNTPIFVIVFAWIWLKEKVNFLQIAGIVVAAVGTLLLISGGNFSFESSTLQGDILVTLNAISYAFYLVYAKELIRKYHPITVTLWSLVMGTSFSFAFCF
jgi:drug/metabolite transporter (DMT)-like permease